MPYVVKDRVKVTSTTTGTGTFTLGSAATGFQSFDAISSSSLLWNIFYSVYYKNFSVAAEETVPNGVFFKPDGTKMYVVGASGDDVNEYNLSSAWDVSSSSYLQNFSISAQEQSPAGIFFKSDGLKMYIVGNQNDSVYEYDLSSAWNISTASYLQSYSVTAQDTVPHGLFFKPDGTKMYVVGILNDSVYEYDLSSAWNISTASYLQSYSVSSRSTQPQGISFKSDGSQMYICDLATSVILQYNLSSAWNVTTATYFQTFSVASQEASPTDLFFNPDGSIMYVVGSTTDSVYQYNIGSNQTYYTISNGTDWEVGIGTVVSGGGYIFRDTILESSNSNNAVNWGAGTKDVFCTYPANATQGTVPTADNSSVGTNLDAWINLKKELDRTVINGVPYDNNSTAGMVSTFSLVYTTGQSYTGGVLAPNGDIHFVPKRAARGQKISLSGVVSTYSLIYTNGAADAYYGGVLAPNGDIHFVPAASPVGQKVSASGVVSTYSLVYTTASGGYRGGVLAPNGDIHFVPYIAPVGQKVSAAGVVSTYSLVYTAGSAYDGGVLAQNGDIHFVPQSANRGQKISAAGVVSTYSLVATQAGAYSGGVLAVNGDIYFVPDGLRTGQKVSAAGVVSTYSLVYTSAAYAGGVLAPNGDIHFVPGSAAVGQKVSASGVVSTYSLVYTVAGAYGGGVLSPDGSITLVSNSAVRGQKISTNTQRNIGYCLSPFFNKY